MNNNFNGKQWVLIKGESHYYISESGDVYNAKRDVFLNPQPGRQGYKRVNIRGTSKYIHIMVCEAFNGHRPKGQVVDHINRCKVWNHYTNLRWASVTINNNNRKITHTRARSFTKSEWREIIDVYLTGEYSQYDITKWANKRFNRISHAMIYNGLVNGRTYKEYYSELTDVELQTISAVIAKYKN